MATTRTIPVILLMILASIALAIGLTIARAFVNHNGVFSTTPGSTTAAVHSVVHDF
jgi:hypothetical protein